MKIFVAGLPLDMDESELEEFFEKYGKVDTVSIAKDRITKHTNPKWTWDWQKQANRERGGLITKPPL